MHNPNPIICLFPGTCRVFKSLQTPTTDTDDTDDDCDVQGQGFYSHGGKCLTHQHFVEQITSAGGFNVHDVQAAEAAHKVNMHLPSLRVRHLSHDATQTAMLKYTCNYILFEELKHTLGFHDASHIIKSKLPGLRLPLRIPFFAGTGTCDTHLVRVQNAFLHPEVRVSVLEFMKLLCVELGLPRDNPVSFRSLRTLHVTYGQSYVREDGLTVFAHTSRRDIVSLSGFHGGNHLCCEMVCFIHLHNLADVLTAIPLATQQDTYVLVRWLEPHPDAWERDAQRRPVCPGPLHINNCLWRYALTDCPRPSLHETRFRGAQRLLFGDTEPEQNRCRERELHAYYGLVTPESIVKIENMCPLFEKDTCSLDSSSWLQSVVMF